MASQALSLLCSPSPKGGNPIRPSGLVRYGIFRRDAVLCIKIKTCRHNINVSQIRWEVTPDRHTTLTSTRQEDANCRCLVSFSWPSTLESALCRDNFLFSCPSTEISRHRAEGPSGSRSGVARWGTASALLMLLGQKCSQPSPHGGKMLASATCRPTIPCCWFLLPWLCHPNLVVCFLLVCGWG